MGKCVSVPKIWGQIKMKVFKKLINKFSFWLYWVFVAAQGLSLVAASGGCSFLAVCLCRLLIVVALRAEHGC